MKFVKNHIDFRYMNFIMLSIAKMNFSIYLTRIDTIKHRKLRIFFDRLTKTFEFLHEQNVRHKNIKSNNILTRDENILFIDFDLSFDFTNANNNITINMINEMISKYCVFEMIVYESRNMTFDI